jgi:hypothetical protein
MTSRPRTAIFEPYRPSRVSAPVSYPEPCLSTDRSRLGGEMLTVLLVIVVILLLTGSGFGLRRRGRRT